jgi:acylglycerol lipase
VARKGDLLFGIDKIITPVGSCFETTGSNVVRLRRRLLTAALSTLFALSAVPGSPTAAEVTAETANTPQTAIFTTEKMCPSMPEKAEGLSKMTDQQLRDYANAAFWNDVYCEAQAAISELLKRNKCDDKNPSHECFELGMNFAICDLQTGELKRARARLKNLYKTVKGSNTNGGMDDPDCLFFIAECQYRLGNYKQAVDSYHRALELYRKVLPPLSPDLAPSLEGLAGCYYRKGQFALVEPLYRELAQIDLLTRGPDDLRYAWSLMNLSDVCHKLGRDNDRKTLFEAAVFIFRKVNEDRIMAKFAEEKDSQPNVENLSAVESTLKRSIFGRSTALAVEAKGNAVKLLGGDSLKAKADPKILAKRPFDFYNWRFKRSQKVDAPGFVIVDPFVPLKGLIICVHGLGLHHRSYEDFGNRISKLGYGIVSFDMRGFGQYRDEKGYDLIDLAGCVEDLTGMVKLFKRDYPNTPLFILGESMGGAIALHVAVKNQTDLDGLISSVPSGTRYKAKKTAFRVGLRFLKHKNQQFDIGDQVIKQATHDESLRKEWKDDPSVRLNLSASELLKFQRFMNQNEKLAKELKVLPVIIFQGYGDKLVKPEGTLSLYNAMGTKYKNLVLIGHQEHLIFEEAQCPDEVIDGLIGWLNNHSKLGSLARK